MADIDQRDKAFAIPDLITVELKKPFPKAAAGGEMVTRINFRPPTVGQMKQISARMKSANDVETAIAMLAAFNADDLTPPELERLTWLDLQLCQEALAPFLSLSAPSAAPKD